MPYKEPWKHKPSRLKRIWTNMKTRCNNPNVQSYKNYGGRGITVCDEWTNSFLSFEFWAKSNGYNDSLTLDRINNNAGYCPDNCRWVTPKDQSRNMRKNVLLEYNSEIKCISAWAEEYNMDPSTIRKRIRLGWDVKSIFETPVDSRRGIRNGTKSRNKAASTGAC